jgi:hypothetical protein
MTAYSVYYELPSACGDSFLRTCHAVVTMDPPTVVVEPEGSSPLIPSPPRDTILNQLHPPSTLTVSLKAYLTVTLPFLSWCSKWTFLKRFPHKNSVFIPYLPILVLCPADLRLLHRHHATLIKCSSCYGTRNSTNSINIIRCTQTRQWTLSWANSILYTPSQPTPTIPTLILSSHERLSLASGVYPLDFCNHFLHIAKLRHACWTSTQLILLFNNPKNTGWRVHFLKLINTIPAYLSFWSQTRYS